VKSTVTLHVVASLDGIIANKQNTVSWMDTTGEPYEKGVPEGTPDDAATSIDCFVLGSRTYEHALELGWPYGDTPAFVVTNRDLPSIRNSVHFYAGDLKSWVDHTLAPQYKNIWLVGGALLCQSFLRLNLVHEIRLLIVPVLLGDGLRLFENSAIESRWNLKNVVAYKTGYVELSYRAASA
jgi:dihydrofolate reductase